MADEGYKVAETSTREVLHIRWHSDRIYTDPRTFVKEATRDVRASSSCDIVLDMEDSLYTLYVTSRGITIVTVQVQCEGAPIAEININRYNKQVELTSKSTNTAAQEDLINEVIASLSELYSDLRE